MSKLHCALTLFVSAGLLLVGAARAEEQQPPGGRTDDVPKRRQGMLADMNSPFPPFHVIGNIYFVGTSSVSCFLITTPQGHILLDSGFEETVPMIRKGIAKLGFRFEDIKILINSHAHIDHSGGDKLVKELTGATIYISERDGELLANGGKGDFNRIPEAVLTYSAVKPDRIVHDGDKVELGGVTLIARLTPGHTKGCTTWTMAVEDEGRRYDVVFYGSTKMLGGGLVNNPKYPNRDADYTETFRILKSLPCDVFLGAHGSFYGMQPKYDKLMKGEKPNPFIDPEGYRKYVRLAEKAYLDALAKEKAEAAAKASAPNP